MRRTELAAMIALTIGVAAAHGCAKSGSAQEGVLCTPGEQVACACPGDKKGVQICLDDGSGYGSCECSDSSTTAATASGTGGAGGNGGAPASTGSELTTTSQSSSQSSSATASSSSVSSSSVSSSSVSSSSVSSSSASSSSVSSSSSSTGAGGGLGCGNCALRFAGQDYVEVPNAQSLTGGGLPLTVEAWVYYDDINLNCMAIVRKGNSQSATYDYWLHKNFAPADSTFWGSNSGFTVIGKSVASKQWIHMAGTYDPANKNAVTYLSGVNVAQSAPFGKPTANPDTLRIGIDWDLGCGMVGVIDEVRISTVVRYGANFNPQTVFVPDMSTVALYHFDEGQGAIAHDASGNGNDGTIHGATWTIEHP